MIAPDRSSLGTDRDSDRLSGRACPEGGRELALAETDDFAGVVEEALGDFEFALCLTHDIDRPYKRHQAIHEAVRTGSLSELRDLLPSRNPYWQFEDLAALEADLGVRSSMYFLQEPHLLRDRPVGEWTDPELWVQFLGRYDVSAPEVAAVVRDLDEGGWEVGLHGSIASHTDPARLRAEKRTVESVLGRPVLGVRQHYLRLEGRETWRRQASLGLRYDASLGSSSEYGFRHGYLPKRPFDDEFLVFPLTVMEEALPAPDGDGGRRAGGERAERECERLLAEAARNGAVMSILWHPRYFSDEEFPGYRRLYRVVVERALEMGAWVGPIGRFYERLADVAASRTAE